MNATEIVIREVQSNCGFQIVQLPREGICQARESAKLHSHREVLPFNEGRADMFGVRIPKSHFGYNLHDSWWGVPRIGAIVLPKIAKQLCELREIHVQTEALHYGFLIEVESICGELHAIRKSLVQIPAEPLRGVHRALANGERGNQLGIGVHRYEDPLIAEISRIALSHVSVFLLHKGPNFIHLNTTARQVFHPVLHEPFTTFSRNDEQRHDRIAIQAP